MLIYWLVNTVRPSIWICLLQWVRGMIIS